MLIATDNLGSAGGLIRVASVLATLLSAFLPWTGYGTPHSFDLSAAFLWNPNAYRGWFSIGLVVLVAGVFAATTLFVVPLQRYRRHSGALIALLATVWQLQTLRGLIESYTDLLHPLRDMVQADFALGPYVAFVAGMLLLFTR